MNIDILDVITLEDDIKYVVCSKVTYQEKNYLYLIDMVDNENIKFGMENKKDNKIFITEIEDENLIRELLPLFFEKAKFIIDDERV